MILLNGLRKKDNNVENKTLRTKIICQLQCKVRDNISNWNTFLFSAITPNRKDNTPKAATSSDICFMVRAILTTCRFNLHHCKKNWSKGMLHSKMRKQERRHSCDKYKKKQKRKQSTKTHLIWRFDGERIEYRKLTRREDARVFSESICRDGFLCCYFSLYLFSTQIKITKWEGGRGWYINGRYGGWKSSPCEILIPWISPNPSLIPPVLLW